MKHRKMGKDCMIVAVLLTLIAAVVLYGCWGEGMEYEPPELDPAIEARIKKDWQEWGRTSTILEVIYFGTYNGYIVFRPFTGIENQIESNYKIAGTIFRGTDLRFYLWKNGDLFELIPAYYEGRLTPDDIRKIGEIYVTNIKDSWPGSESSLNEYMEWYFNSDDIDIGQIFE